MERTELPKEYKYKVMAEDFVKLFLASDSQFYDIKKEFLNEGKQVDGIKRDIPVDWDTPEIFMEEDIRCTIVENTEISSNIEIKGYDACRSLICINSKISSVFLIALSLKDKENLKGGHFYFNNCEVGFIRAKIKSQIGDILLNNSFVDGLFILNDSNVGNLKITDSTLYSIMLYKNCNIKNIETERITLNNFRLSINCSLGDCIITKDSKINLLKLDDNSSCGNIVVKNSKLDLINIEKSKINNLLLTYNSEILRFEINTGTMNDLSIGTSKMDKAVFSCSMVGMLVLTNSVLNEVYFDNNLSKEIKLTNNCIVQNILLNNSMTGNILIEYSKAENIKIFDNSKIGYFQSIGSALGTITGINLDNSFSLVSTNVSLLDLEDCNIPEFRVMKSCKIEAYIMGGKINLIKFKNATFDKNSLMSLVSIQVYAFSFEQFVALGSILIKKIQRMCTPFTMKEIYSNNDVNTQEYEAHSFEEKILLSRTTIIKEKVRNDKPDNYLKGNNIFGPTLRFLHSSLGNSEFTDFPFADYELQFYNSNIMDCIVLGNSVPSTNIKIITLENELITNDFIEYEQKALLFSQLKKVFEKRGDLYYSAIFQYEWSVNQNKYLIKKGIYKNFQNIFIFVLNQISNKHGQSWFRPLLWLLLGCLPLYIVFLLTMGRIFNGNNIDWNLIGYYFNFLNPLHYIDYIPGENTITSWTSLVDIIAKVASAFFIYKFLSSFKKYGKK